MVKYDYISRRIDSKGHSRNRKGLVESNHCLASTKRSTKCEQIISKCSANYMFIVRSIVTNSQWELNKILKKPLCQSYFLNF